MFRSATKKPVRWGFSQKFYHETDLSVKFRATMVFRRSRNCLAPQILLEPETPARPDDPLQQRGGIAHRLLWQAPEVLMKKRLALITMTALTALGGFAGVAAASLGHPAPGKNPNGTCAGYDLNCKSN